MRLRRLRPTFRRLTIQSVGAAVSLQQQMEKHRANAICASCHVKMDGLGFGLENNDGIGKVADAGRQVPGRRLRAFGARSLGSESADAIAADFPGLYRFTSVCVRLYVQCKQEE